MKNIFIFLVAGMLSIASCSDEETPSKDGSEQVPQPVENAGAETEAERAIEATVNDTTKAAERKDTAK